MRNAATRTDEHEQPNGKSEPSKHLKNKQGHKFDQGHQFAKTKTGICKLNKINKNAIALIIGTNFSKSVFPIKDKRNKYHPRILICELVEVLNFTLNKQF